MKASNLALTLVLLVVATTANDCFMGEYYDSNQKSCQQCDISCASCSSSQGCTSCYTQMYLRSQGNSVLCDLCYNIVKNCQICISATKCESCSNGYLLDSNKVCQSCSSQLDNCLYCFQNSTILQCIVCDFNYTLVQGTCISNESNSTQNDTGITNGSSQSQGSNGQVQSNQQSQGSGSSSAGQSSSLQVDQGTKNSMLITQCQSNEV
jgi:proprotein convertase subtilisin/kexin type 5